MHRIHAAIVCEQHSSLYDNEIHGSAHLCQTTWLKMSTSLAGEQTWSWLVSCLLEFMWILIPIEVGDKHWMHEHC